jgi:arginase
MSISLLGFEWDASSSYARGTAAGPGVIRSILFSDASSPYSLGGVDIRQVLVSLPFPQLDSDPARAREQISDAVAAQLAAGQQPLSLGGDHSVTYPVLQAIRDYHGPVNVLHIDAHPDMYEEFDGDRYSHACPFARALEDGCIKNLVQLGIRSSNPQLREFGRRYDVTMLGADEADKVPYERLSSPLYISIDLDGLDPAFAPGVTHQEPGGLTTREVIGVIARCEGAVVGADVVELNPERDLNLLTANLAVRLVKELAGKMTEGNS